MKIRTNLKASGRIENHNQTLVRDVRKLKGLKVKTNLKAGRLKSNHNQTLVRDTR